MGENLAWNHRIIYLFKELTRSVNQARVQFPNSKFQIFFPATAWRLKSRRKKNALRLLSVNGETNLMNLISL